MPYGKAKIKKELLHGFKQRLRKTAQNGQFYICNECQIKARGYPGAFEFKQCSAKNTICQKDAKDFMISKPHTQILGEDLSISSALFIVLIGMASQSMNKLNETKKQIIMWQRMNSVNQVFLAAQKNTLTTPLPPSVKGLTLPLFFNMNLPSFNSSGVWAQLVSIFVV